ncbi:hypothetical protein ACFSO7_22475 [Bacillus sp. CGMCC 1.16607]|uniref:hypothetical protein n=1 Tax=Bacillus sp. CGMCC 1.16607 TaxID=3351842 RepID=UPI0036344E34
MVEIKSAVTYARKSIKVKDLSIEDSVSYQQVKMDTYAKEHKLEIIKSSMMLGIQGKM